METKMTTHDTRRSIEWLANSFKNNNSNDVQTVEQFKEGLSEHFESQVIIDHAAKLIIKHPATTTGRYLNALKPFESHLKSAGIEVTEIESRETYVNFTDKMAMQGQAQSSIGAAVAAMKKLRKHISDYEGIDLPAVDVKASDYNDQPEEQIPDQLERPKIRKLIAAPEILRDTLIIATYYYLGLRKKELTNIDDSDINREQQTIQVTGKGGKTRTVPYSEDLKPLLNRWRDEIRPLYQEGDESALFLWGPHERPSGRISTEKCYKIVKEAAEEAGIQEVIGRDCNGNPKYRVHPHVLRHSYGSHSIEDGIPVHVLSDLMGHESIETTMRYVHQSNNTLFDSYHANFEGV